MLTLKRYYIIRVSQRLDKFLSQFQSRCLISLIGRGQERNKVYVLGLVLRFSFANFYVFFVCMWH